MSKHKHTNKICIAIICIALVIAGIFVNGKSLGLTTYESGNTYETALFDDSYVHTINIVIDEDDWDEMMLNAADEEYMTCTVEIDDDVLENVAIRTKGNSSLRDLVSSDSDRYSFKIEFDHYDDSLLYYGLDKLSLNNIYQDDTYLKDYLSYEMFNYMDVEAPLASYAYITINGEGFGLYLAVEAVEDSFVDRAYGEDSDGELYKPETTGEIEAMNDTAMGEGTMPDETMAPEGMEKPMPDEAMVPEGMEKPMPDEAIAPEGMEDSAMPDRTMASMQPGSTEDTEMLAKDNAGGMMSMSNSNGATLEYTDDEYTSYTDIFDNAKTDITDDDKDTLIASLKTMNSGEGVETAVDVDSVIDYFVVHNYLLNFDSYTGSMLHNYYLYEEDGILSMIPWDYNLSFGTFIVNQNDTATDYVNYAIDTPTANTTTEERPMLNMILSDDEYLEQYHEEFEEFIEVYFESGHFEETITSVSEMIAPYVEKDPTAFCTYEEFVKGVDTLEEFCLLRAESITGQLDGSIPSTTEEQIGSTYLINADDLIMSDLGER